MRKTAAAVAIVAAAVAGLNRADTGAAAQPIAACRWGSCFCWRLLFGDWNKSED